MLAKTPLITTGISILHHDTMASNFLVYTPASVWLSNRANSQTTNVHPAIHLLDQHRCLLQQIFHFKVLC